MPLTEPNFNVVPPGPPWASCSSKLAATRLVVGEVVMLTLLGSSLASTAMLISFCALRVSTNPAE